jgi:hypothetical protein
MTVAEPVLPAPAHDAGYLELLQTVVAGGRGVAVAAGVRPLV